MKLFYHALGEGEPLMILHGLFGISDNWMGMGKILSERYRVIIPDLRNHGRSPYADAFSYPAMGEDLMELLESLHITTLNLLGHSMGGKLAMYFATNHPEMVEKLVVVDISPRKTRARQIHFKLLRAMKSVNFDDVHSRQDVDDMLRKFIIDTSLRQFILKNLTRLDYGRYAWRINIEGIEKNMDEIMEDVTPQIPYQKPTLFIRGGNSDYITQEDVNEMPKTFPLHRLETIPGADHWVHAEKSEQMVVLLNDFL